MNGFVSLSFSLSASLLLLSRLLMGSFGIVCFGLGFGLTKCFFSRLTAGWDLTLPTCALFVYFKQRRSEGELLLNSCERKLKM